MDETEVNHFIQKHQKNIFKFLLKNVKDPQTAEDLTQDILLQYVNQLNHGTTIDNHKNYLFTISRNRLIDHWKKVADDRQQQKIYWDTIRENHTAQVMPWDDHDQKVIYTNLKEELTERQKQIFTLHRQKGYSYQEIADKLKISRSTVRKHMIAALKRIRRYMTVHADKLMLILGCAAF